MDWEEEKEQFFRDLYDETNRMLIRIAYRITYDMEIAEEICHDAFIKLFNRSERIPEQAQMQYWLIRVVKNMALNYCKRQKRERKAYEKVLKEQHKKVESGEDITLRKEFTHIMREAINNLPQKLKEVLVLIEYGQLNYREIGRVLNISESNVKVRASRARKKLATFLIKEGVNAPE